MPRDKVTQVYKFDELDERAKERARDWYRSGAFDYEWWECTFDDAKECLKLAGFDVDRIYFSGFASQGDGACFDGSWRASDARPVKDVRAHAPKDKELHRIAARMKAIARARPHASMSVKHSGRYLHETCTDFSVDVESAAYNDGRRRTSAQWDAIKARDAAIEDDIIETSRDAMRWIYRRLEAEFEYLNSNEQVDETIRISEYEFTEDGRRA